ncbi:MAG: type IV secretory system conjugative DNA transfer family protein [Planctomycetota bacterium]
MKANRREDPFARINNRQLLTVPAIRNILAQRKNKLDLRMAIDSRKIVLGNLAKGRLGERTSMFLGSLLMTRLQLDAMSRSDRPENRRPDFFLYVDEFQNFATPSFAEVLSEARKYRLNLTLANQFLGQMPESLTQAILGNVGTIVSFQVGAEDATILSEQLGENPRRGSALPRFHRYVRTDLEGVSSRPFSCERSLPRAREPTERARTASSESARVMTHRTVVESAIAQRFERGQRATKARCPVRLSYGRYDVVSASMLSTYAALAGVLEGHKGYRRARSCWTRPSSPPCPGNVA